MLAAGLQSGIVLDIGNDETCIVPVSNEAPSTQNNVLTRTRYMSTGHCTSTSGRRGWRVPP
ncbi:MAG: hypothetical protein EON55_22950 [Alphaproteobacteria bacterium]|nr:MAG: hypothetical protein EON55_22950 [Alphaproteobacteria bacterium]